jgi:ribonuclease P protein subunit POP4
VIELDPKKLLRHELIGLEAKITDSKNKHNIGIKGKITDETRNTLSIGNKKILKKDVMIEIKTDDQNIIIDGKKLIKSPEERLKI